MYLKFLLPQNPFSANLSHSDGVLPWLLLITRQKQAVKGLTVSPGQI